MSHHLRIIVIVLLGLLCAVDGWGEKVWGFLGFPECTQYGARSIVPRLRETLDTSIAGQQHAKKVIFRRLSAHFRDGQVSNKPLLFHFCGPTSVGKTQTASYIGESIFQGCPGPHCGVHVIPMEAYGTLSQLPSLHDLIAKHLMKCPTAVLVLDDAHKVQAGVVSALLKLFDSPHASLIHGEKHVQLNQAIVIFTTDMGVHDFPHDMDQTMAMDRVLEMVHHHWPKATGLDALSSYVVPFLPLTLDDLKEVVKLELKKKNTKLQAEYANKWTGAIEYADTFPGEFVNDCRAHDSCISYAGRGVQGHLEVLVDSKLSVLLHQMTKSALNHDNVELVMGDGEVIVQAENVLTSRSRVKTQKGADGKDEI